MAVRETLELDLRGALQQINELERQIDDLRRPVDIPVDITGNAPTEIRAIDDRLDDIQNGARNVNRELGDMEQAASGAANDFTRLSTEMGQSEDSARGISREIAQARDAAARLDSATDGASRSIDRAEDEAGRLTSELRQADRAAEGINTRSTALVGTFGSLSGLAAGIGGALAAIGGAAVLGGALRGANAAVQSFAQLEDSINAVNVVFKDGADIALQFGERSAQAAGLSETAFNQAIAPIGALLTNFGFNAREAADASVILVQRGADLASVYGGSVNDALLAINSALVGQVEPLRRFGGEISQARVEAFALATGLLQAGQKMDNTVAVQARLGLILRDTAVVAGDFANTSEDLANAQRIAAAEAANFGADIGEVLAPAMEVLVGLVPELLEGLRQLVPGFANAAGSAADFFNSVEQGAGGFRAPLQAVSAGLGLVGDSLGGLADLGSGVFDTLSLNFEGVGEQMDQFADRFTRATQRVVGQNLARALDQGADKLTAFGNALSAFGREEENIRIFADTYRTFAIQANLTGEELRVATLFLIQNAEAAGLSAAEVKFLNEQLALLNDTLGGTDVGLQRTANRIRDDLGGAFSTTTTQFTTFTSELEEIPERMSSVIAETRAAAGLVGEALNPFAEAEEDLGVSAQEFFTALTAEITAQATFQAGIAELVMREQFDLAAMLGAQGPKVQSTLEGFLDDVDLADAANEAIKTGATGISEQLATELQSAIAGGNLAPEVEQAFIELLEAGIFTNSAVKGAIVDGTAEAANTTVSNYAEELAAEIDLLDPSILQQKLAGLFSGVTFPISADQFVFPDSGSFSGTIGAGAVFDSGGGGGGVQVIINNPTTTDLPTNTAQATQSIGAAAATFNRIGGT